jgi:Family of unknown function (DUF6491)
MEVSMRLTFSVLASVCGLLLAVPQAVADPTPPGAKPAQCFSVGSFENWRALDARTIYIRVNMHRYYRLDLANACPSLLWPDSHLVTTWRGPNIVCSALDWDLKVSQGMHGIPMPCIVKTMTALTAEEAAAIPKRFKP